MGNTNKILTWIPWSAMLQHKIQTDYWYHIKKHKENSKTAAVATLLA